MTSLRHRNAPHASPDPNAGGDLSQGSSSSTLQMGSPSNNEEPRSATSARPSLMSGNRSNSLRNSWKFEGGGSPSPHYSKYNPHSGIFGGAAGWKNGVALMVGFVLFVAPWTRYIQLHWTARTMQSNLEQLQTQQRKLQKELSSQTETLKKITADTTRHKEENDVLLGNLKAFGDDFDDFDSAAYEAAEETEDAYLKRISELEKEIQRSSARQLVSHGYSLMGTAAPIRAVITLNENVGGMGNQIVLEMAPSHTYAHAISFFFMLVQKKRFFDGLTLMRTSGSSLVYTVPIHFETKEMSAETMQHFEMSTNGVTLDKLTVLEYPQAEEDYPIEKYSGKCVRTWRATVIEPILQSLLLLLLFGS